MLDLVGFENIPPAQRQYNSTFVLGMNGQMSVSLFSVKRLEVTFD